MGSPFSTIKKSSGDGFGMKKDKENKGGLFLKKKKMVYTYLKS